MQAPSFQLILSRAIKKSRTFDWMMGLLTTRFVGRRCKGFFVQAVLRILNWFLVENIACGRHLWRNPDSFGCESGIFLSELPKKASGKRTGWAVEIATRATADSVRR
jgi:hypothetical protein